MVPGGSCSIEGAPTRPLTLSLTLSLAALSTLATLSDALRPALHSRSPLLYLIALTLRSPLFLTSPLDAALHSSPSLAPSDPLSTPLSRRALSPPPLRPALHSLTHSLSALSPLAAISTLSDPLSTPLLLSPLSLRSQTRSPLSSISLLHLAALSTLPRLSPGLRSPFTHPLTHSLTNSQVEVLH